MHKWIPLLLGAGALLVACKNDVGSQNTDAPVPPDARARCGNGIVEAGEECDDGNQTVDLECDELCRVTCGNGRLEDGELCDINGQGTDACPTTCDDGQSCTADVLAGSECQAYCASAPITTNRDGDGCCLTGSNGLLDSDCAAECGNGLVEPGEQCDTSATAPGLECPTACNDGLACTTNQLTGSGCAAACEYPAITTAANGDGCCPPGATAGTDSDCLATCGNGQLDPGETCDGNCPTTCAPDGNSCTREVVDNVGSCTATCRSVAITEPAAGDGCCPPGANANSDSDCAPTCGNMVRESGEQCDDGNSNPSDGCHQCIATPPAATVFRINNLDLRDPHVYVKAVACFDVTDTPLAGFSVNGEMQTALTTDSNADGFLDYSPIVLFRPLIQDTPTQGEFQQSYCTFPEQGSTCFSSGSSLSSVFSNLSVGTCLGPVPGTTRGYSPAITSATAPCFVSETRDFALVASGIQFPLRSAQISATYVGDPALGLVSGVIRGFVREVDADNSPLPAELPLVGGKPLSLLLPGGSPGSETNCSRNDDRDTHDGHTGWWFYMNFTATRAQWASE